MVLKIEKFGSQVLKEKAKEVDELTPEIKELIFNMKETLRQAQGVGLAAPQVGVSKRVVVVETEKGAVGFINPKIIKKSREKETQEEGCLCMPGIFLRIKRAKEVGVEAQNETGEIVKIETKGLLARIFQHEIDHLDGILITDRISFWKKLCRLFKI
ncbi:MAG: peptide deformylase [Candidatus Staskawiczbacteria bacterium]|nr:peptide deformylase [Candidatus Staskawiczbacteria bacterium]